MDERRLRGGDTLLIQATEKTIQRFGTDRNFVLARELLRPDFRTNRIPVALGIIAAVVALAALEVVPILVSALGGVVAMVATGCVEPNEVYSSVDWSVIFLLAGLIPLGVAMERTGAAEWLASVVVAAGIGLSPLAFLALFYLFTALITNVISNNASVVLMIPVAIDAAQAIGADPFPFVLAVTFAASTAMLTPIGYQTNLMVYGPGGYKFTDFFRVGAPLQIILTVVTTLGIAVFWGSDDARRRPRPAVGRPPVALRTRALVCRRRRRGLGGSDDNGSKRGRRPVSDDALAGRPPRTARRGARRCRQGCRRRTRRPSGSRRSLSRDHEPRRRVARSRRLGADRRHARRLRDRPVSTRP